MACQGLLSNEILVLLRRLAEAELVDKLRVDRVLAASVAEDLPGDLRRTPDEEAQAPDVRVVMTARRGREEVSQFN